MLNACLAKQSAIVKKHGGDIDKFVGDELVAVFEGREMIERAMRAAIEIQGNIGQLPGEVESGVIKVGIGINTGEMVMGAMGSPERMDYTVIGDNVNLGARLCSSAKAGQILVSGSTAGLISGNPEFHLKRLDPLTVKGKEKPIEVYEVQGNDR
jgi:adenylate cyclase